VTYPSDKLYPQVEEGEWIYVSSQILVACKITFMYKKDKEDKMEAKRTSDVPEVRGGQARISLLQI
jgi:hypothetical protein